MRDFTGVMPPPCPWLLIQGESDEIVSAAGGVRLGDETQAAPTVVRMPDTGHFFHRRLLDLRGAIKNGVRNNLPPLARCVLAGSRRGGNDESASALPSEAYAHGVAAGHWQADGAQAGRVARARPDPRAAAGWPRRDSMLETPGRALPRSGGGAGPVPVGQRRPRQDLPGRPAVRADAGDVPKRRWHFHRFMGEVHARLRALPDTADTLAVVARDLSADLRLLVLDEFFVGDIGDAMILGRLLDQLIARGVTLVTTSNIPPSELYRDGLQRASFLPCIALIERHCQVRRLDSAQDYRLRQLTRAATYLTPLGDRQRAGAGRAFRAAGGDMRRARPRPCS